MTLKRDTHTMKETQTFKCILKLHKILMIALLCVCYVEKQRQSIFFWLLQKYNKCLKNVKWNV